MIPPYALAIITRCTGPGGVRWQHVAQQTGRSVHSVRAEFDPTYLRDERPVVEAGELADRCAPAPPRLNSYEPSPFRALALKALLNGPLDTAELAVITDTTRDRVSSRMTSLINLGLAVRYRQWGPKSAPLYRLSEAGAARAEAAG